MHGNTNPDDVIVLGTPVEGIYLAAADGRVDGAGWPGAGQFRRSPGEIRRLAEPRLIRYVGANSFAILLFMIPLNRE